MAVIKLQSIVRHVIVNHHFLDKREFIVQYIFRSNKLIVRELFHALKMLVSINLIRGGKLRFGIPNLKFII